MLPSTITQTDDKQNSTLWLNDIAFHAFHTFYSWLAPYSLTARHYQLGKSWLYYLTSDNKLKPSIGDNEYLLRTRINAFSMEVIIRGLAKARVKKLKVTATSMDDDAILLLANFLADNEDIEHFGIGPYVKLIYSGSNQIISDEIISTLLAGLQRNNTITKFQMKDVNLSVKGWSNVATMLKHSNVIQEIKINYCDLSDFIETQTTTVQVNSSLRLLDLSFCTLPDDTSIILTSFVHTGAILDSLILKDIRMPAGGLASIAKAFAQNLVIVKRLHISHGDIHISEANAHSFELGVKALFSHITHNT